MLNTQTLTNSETSMITETQKLKYSFIFPSSFLAVVWLIKLIEHLEQIDFAYLGVQPLTFTGLVGILASPFLHSGFAHLISNSIPFLVLAPSVFYFYRGIAFKIFLYIFFVSGIGVWLFGRPYYHIGLSGVVYGLAAFLFFSGVIRKHINLLAISLLVTFLYGSMIWGIFPSQTLISWEAHLSGFAVGTILAWAYRHEGIFVKNQNLEDELLEEDSEFIVTITEEGAPIYHLHKKDSIDTLVEKK